MKKPLICGLSLVLAAVFWGCDSSNDAPPPAASTPPSTPADQGSEATNEASESEEPSVADSAAETNAEPSAAAPADDEETGDEVAVIKTNMGTMAVEFWPDVAPKTVANFKKLAEEGFYDGTAFHRVVKGFMIQGGDPLTKDPAKKPSWGTGGPGYSIQAEFNERPHERGVISMARSANPNSAGSQFFICLERAPSLDRSYTVFGKLVAGEDVLLKIGDTPVEMNPSGMEQSSPVSRVHVESVKIVPRDALQDHLS